MKCRICESENEYLSIRADYVFGGNDDDKFWHCKNCDVIFLYPIPSIEEEKFFYLKEFEKFMSKRVGDHRDWTNAEKHKTTNFDQVLRRMKFLNEYIKPGTEILEIGCSSGFMLDEFKKKGANCWGVEPSGEFGEFLSKSGHEYVEDISELSEKKYDLITHFFVFEHMRDPFEFLKTTQKMLKTNGVHICEIPCYEDALTSLYKIPAFEKFYWSKAHHYYYNFKSLEFILKKLNYKFKLVPEQRYDISNHITWLQDGVPGGQGKYNDYLSIETREAYRKSLIDSKKCDTIFLYIWK